MHYNQRGHTLLELSVFLLLLSAACSLVAPTGHDNSRQLERQILIVEGILERARAAAFQTNGPHLVKLQPESIQVVANNEQVTAMEIDPPYQFSGTHSQFTFTASGTASPGRLRIDDGSGSCEITISLFGRSSHRCQKN